MFIPLPTITPDVGRDHTWLQYSDELVGRYNAYDVLATMLARRELPRLIEQSGNAAYWEYWWNRVIPAALNIQRRGFGHLDRARLHEMQRQLVGEVDAIEARLLEAVPWWRELRLAALDWRDEQEACAERAARFKAAARRDGALKPATGAKRRAIGLQSRLVAAERARASFLNSPDAKARWLFDVLELVPAPATHKRPARSTGQHALLHIHRHLRKRDEPHRWVLEELFHRSRLNTILTRYIGRDSRSVPFGTGPEERIYYHQRTYAAETLRWAASDPPLDQWPQRLRSLVRAREGHVFVSADWKQLEVRILALYAQERADLDALADPTRDIHTETVWDLWPSMRAEWDTVPAERKALARTFAKNKRYELNYGGSGLGGAAKAFCPCPRTECREAAPASMQLSPEEQQRIMKRWEAMRPRTWAWRRALYNEVVAAGKRWVCPVSGYTRQFLRPAKDIRTELANYPMQHTAAELLNRAAVALDEMGIPIVKTIHDQVILEVPIADAENAAKVLREVMERPVPELDGAVFPVDIHTGVYWSDLK